MAIIKQGNTINVFPGDAVQVSDELAPGVYKLRFSPMSGHSLEKTQFAELPDRIWGNHESRIERVFKHYENQADNFGVMLHGDKGLGKTLFAKVLAKEAEAKGYPVVFIDSHIPNAGDFLLTLGQDAVVIFDEFEKHYEKKSSDEYSQADMLSFFDGTSGSHLLIITTLNDISGVNPFMIDRPGRFHYSFEASYPTPEEIREFLADDIDTDAINMVVKNAEFVQVSWDSLSALRKELLIGTSVPTAFEDLNIASGGSEKTYKVEIFRTGKEGVRELVHSRTWDMNILREDNFHVTTPDGEPRRSDDSKVIMLDDKSGAVLQVTNLDYCFDHSDTQEESDKAGYTYGMVISNYVAPVAMGYSAAMGYSDEASAK